MLTTSGLNYSSKIGHDSPEAKDSVRDAVNSNHSFRNSRPLRFTFVPWQKIYDLHKQETHFSVI